MGVKFYQTPNGPDHYCCTNCLLAVTSADQVKSTSFTAASGPAFLFDHVVNIVQGETKVSELRTGQHVIRDVHCKKCHFRLGWLYEFATEPSQMYKEGSVVLELAAIRQFYPESRRPRKIRPQEVVTPPRPPMNVFRA